jgi:hypothetical protein
MSERCAILQTYRPPLFSIARARATQEQTNYRSECSIANAMTLNPIAAASVIAVRASHIFRLCTYHQALRHRSGSEHC